MDKIGLFKGKPISEMTREELLGFAAWAGKELSRLGVIEREMMCSRAEKEIKFISDKK